MFWWVKNISAGFRFIFIKESEGFVRSKKIIEFVFPLILTSVFLFFYHNFPEYFRKEILSYFDEKIYSFVIFMVPFHLAALAIISTYQSSALDEELEGSSAFVNVWSNEDQKYVKNEIKLRQYMMYLFGYLCSIGIIYLVISIFSNSMVIEKQILDLYKYVVFLQVLFIFHYIVLSYYSIYFIISKIK
jgi:hypothetical protein